MIFQDLFTDSNGTNLTAHTPDIDTAGNGWVDQVGSMEIQSNEAAADGNERITTVDVENADVEISCDVITPSSGSRGLAMYFRWVNSSDYWRLFVTPLGASASQNALLLQKFGGTGYQQYNPDAPGVVIDNSQTYTIRINLNGDDITVYLDDVEEISATNSQFNTATIHGIYAERNPAGGGGTLDNYSITAL